MTNRWHEVARLGSGGERYPHVLVDSYGWCLRLGPASVGDRKYYSSLPALLEGILEHTARRAFLSAPSAPDLGEFRRKVEDALGAALRLSKDLVDRHREELGRYGCAGGGSTESFVAGGSEIRTVFDGRVGRMLIDSRIPGQ